MRRSHGLFESFEREYYDMMRSAFLKYNFQVRIGHMDGILVAYHNTRKIFGFQYISREEMDARLFGGRLMGDQAFHHCLALFDAVLTEATSKFPEQVLQQRRLGMGRRDLDLCHVYFFSSLYVNETFMVIDTSIIIPVGKEQAQYFR